MCHTPITGGKISTTNKENTIYFPLRISQKTKTCLNNQDFFVTIIA
ncbi:4929_t:CDS:1, partial [Funneliformis caledonium]